MRVTVRLFAALRERAGTGKREIEVPEGAVVGDVFAALGIGAEPAGLNYALNQEYADRAATLSDGDEVAVISPVSGGPQAKSFHVATVKRLYANFVWKTPAAAGQVLRIEWHDPGGTLRAVWNDKTIKDDKKGTRLYAWIGPAVVKGKLGGWTAVLTVGSTRIGQAKFRIVA